MKLIAGILLLIAGVVFPMVMLFQVNSALSRKPAPRPAHVGLMLALNGLLPLGLVTLGLGLLSPKLWALPWLRIIVLAALVASAIALLALAFTARAERRHDGG